MTDVVAALAAVLVLLAEMTWDTWWALVLGFALSGAVEAFVSDGTMEAVLGDDDPEDLGLAALLGAASSSCSYSAVGTTKTLFTKGASGAASVVFLFASTDLVVELGLVLFVLLGWQFVVGEYVGGVVAVLVLAVIFTRLVPDSWVEAAREHARQATTPTCGTCDAELDDDAVPLDADSPNGGGDGPRFCCAGCRNAFEARESGTALADRLTSLSGWRGASRAAMKDWEMLWTDVLLGFIVAAVVGALVPAAWWAAIFPSEATVAGVLVATAIAILVGVLTSMCSVGNVPFALVLWRNGLPFGSVLAFIYADLVIPPLVNVYRRHYGGRFAATLTASFAVAAFVAGVAVHYLLAPIAPPTGTLGGTVPDQYTAALNAAFTPVFALQAYAAYGWEGIRERGETVAEAVEDWFAVALWGAIVAATVLVSFVSLLAAGAGVVAAAGKALWAGVQAFTGALAKPGRQLRVALGLLWSVAGGVTEAAALGARRARERFRDDRAFEHEQLADRSLRARAADRLRRVRDRFRD